MSITISIYQEGPGSTVTFCSSPIVSMNAVPATAPATPTPEASPAHTVPASTLTPSTETEAAPTVTTENISTPHTAAVSVPMQTHPADTPFAPANSNNNVANGRSRRLTERIRRVCDVLRARLRRGA